MNYNNLSEKITIIQKKWNAHNRRDKFYIISMLFLAFFIMITSILSPIFPKFAYLNTSLSAPRGIYIPTSEKEIKRGDFVVLETKDRLDLFKLKNPPKYLLKHIVAMPGERYQVTENAMIIENNILPRTTSPSGIILPHPKIGTFYLDTNEYLVANDPKESYDSRYFGIVTVDEIKKVIPLITIPDSW